MTKRLWLGAVAVLVFAGCTHIETRTIEIREPSRCPIKRDSKGSQRAGDFPLVMYVGHLAKSTSLVFKEATRAAIADLRNDGADLKIANADGKIATDFRVLLTADGDVLKWETTCAFGVKELDDAMIVAQRSITHVDPPPAKFLNSQHQLSAVLQFIIEK